MMQNMEEKLLMKREKPRNLNISITYRLIYIAKKLFGKERVLRHCLNKSRLYGRFAFETAGELYGADFHNYAKALNEDFLKKWIPANGAVIDIGCGVGRWCEVASKYAERVVGIDYDENLISEARATVKAKNVEFIVGDLTEDLKKNKFDLALLIHVIEHIEDVDKLLEELKEVAKTLIVEVPDFESDSLNWMRLRHNLPFYSDSDHVREYTTEMLVNQIERNGWKILEIYKNGGAVLAVSTFE